VYENNHEHGGHFTARKTLKRLVSDLVRMFGKGAREMQIMQIMKRAFTESPGGREALSSLQFVVVHRTYRKFRDLRRRIKKCCSLGLSCYVGAFAFDRNVST
jgi:hypothetical protein